MKNKFYQNVLKHEVDYSINDILTKYCNYKEDHYWPYVNQHKKFYKFTERLYMEAKDVLGVYYRSYDEFLELLKSHKVLEHVPFLFRHRYRLGKYYFSPSPGYRQKTKYQKNKSCIKITSKDKSKVDWREYKKLRRDKSRREPHWNPRACPKSYKKKANGSHRAWERSKISQKDWESLMDTKKLSWLQDPWDWD